MSPSKQKTAIRQVKNLYTNLFPVKNAPEEMEVKYLKITDLKQNDGSRYAKVVGLARTLNNKGIQACPATKGKKNEYQADIAILKGSESKLDSIANDFEIVGEETLPHYTGQYKKLFDFVVGHSFRDDWASTGSYKFVRMEELKNRNKTSREAIHYSIQWLDDQPMISLEPTRREMIPLNQPEEGDQARVLPYWQKVEVVEVTDKTFDEEEIGTLNGPEYWMFKYGINIPDDSKLVKVKMNGNEVSYPIHALFKEHSDDKVSMKERSKSKLKPQERLEKAQELVNKYFQDIEFGDSTLKVRKDGNSAANLDLTTGKLENQKQISLKFGNGKTRNLGQAIYGLQDHGPVSGKKEVHVHLICKESDKELGRKLLEQLQREFKDLNLGELVIHIDEELMTSTDFPDEFEEKAGLYFDKIKDSDEDKLQLPLVLMPKTNDKRLTEIYFSHRGHLLPRQIPLQSFKASTAEDVVSHKKFGQPGNPTTQHTALQLYTKPDMKPPWKLEASADSESATGSDSSCFVGFDTSRYHEEKKGASAYSAVVDAEGQVVHLGTDSFSGEKMTVKDIRKVIRNLVRDTHKRKGDDFKRLVIYRDGADIHRESDNWQKAVLESGEGSRSIKKMIEDSSAYPDELTIDLVYVNKSPSIRVFKKGRGNAQNPESGTYIQRDEETGWLNVTDVRYSTARPLEFQYKQRFTLGNADYDKPPVSQIMKEYHKQTVLNWATVYRKTKFALPQVLTQEIAKHAAKEQAPRNVLMI